MNNVIFETPKSFEWDGGNRDKSWLKHRVKYTEAEEVFFNGPALFSEDRKHSTDKEKRYLVMGRTNKNTLLSVFFTMREETIRVISARPMSKRERGIFNEKA